MISCKKEEELINKTTFGDVEIKYEAIELEVMNRVNSYRNQLGLATLSRLDVVSKEAETHSIYMVKQGEVNHDDFNIRVQNLKEKAAAISVGENVAFGYKTAESLLTAWLNSPSHTGNIEDERFTDFGISVKKNEVGDYYVTQIFIERN